jgi:hypothetical protein
MLVELFGSQRRPGSRARRGPFLWEFVQSAQDGRALPTPDGLSAGWCETVGLLLVGRVREFDLEPYRDRLRPDKIGVEYGKDNFKGGVERNKD